ncbi:MAG: peptidoglycan DD-metalloendopeptidase family protein [Propionibacteriaceae bacterium]|jgi:murein DD-endopeptidase MepM/ murein hydrolase activator NlpD|nr:peptidoglycan DD-metalloendopeptidase family protein [Propionibacteriaceae bacterium]
MLKGRRWLAGLAGPVMAVALALAGLSLGSAPAAGADDLDSVRQQLERYEQEQTEVNQRLNDAQQRLTNARSQLDQTRAQADDCRAQIEQMQSDVTQLALLQWQSQGMNSALAILGGHDLSDILADLATNQWMATTTNDQLQRYLLERANLLDLEQSQETTLAQIAAEEAQIEELSQAAAAKVDELQRLLNRLTAQEQAALALSRGGNGTASVDVSAIVTSAGLVKPITAAMGSPFGWRVSPITGASEFHDGVDYGSPCGTPVWAAANGVVARVEWYYGYGNRVVVDHGVVDGRRLATSYNHLSSAAVTAGAIVSQGQVIAYVGATGMVTGCHLHFSVYVDVDPATQYAKGNANAEDFY